MGLCSSLSNLLKKLEQKVLKKTRICQVDLLTQFVVRSRVAAVEKSITAYYSQTHYWPHILINIGEGQKTKASFTFVLVLDSWSLQNSFTSEFLLKLSKVETLERLSRCFCPPIFMATRCCSESASAAFCFFRWFLTAAAAKAMILKNSKKTLLILCAQHLPQLHICIAAHWGLNETYITRDAQWEIHCNISLWKLPH